MKRMRRWVFCLGLFVALPVAALPMTANVAGNWTLTVVEPTTPCTWVGPLTLVQSGSSFSGSGTLSIQPGSDPGCLPTLSGTVTGGLLGFSIDFGLAIGGSALFDGTVSDDQQSMAGTWVFSPLSGTWHAERVVGVRAPALDAAGLGVLLVLLIASGAALARRRAARPLSAPH